MSIPHWVHMGLLSGPHMGPLWVCRYELGILAPHASFMGVSLLACPYGSIIGLAVWANPYTSHTGPIWDSYLGPTWVPYVSYKGVPIWASPYTFHTGPIWACYLGQYLAVDATPRGCTKYWKEIKYDVKWFCSFCFTSVLVNPLI